VCIVITGPGVLNVATAAASAYSDSVPVLIVSTGMPESVYRRDVGYAHESKDQSKAMDSLVSWSHRASSPLDVVASIYRAFSEFGSRRPRPIHVEIPLDVLNATEAVTLPAPIPAALPTASKAAIGEAVRILEDASRHGLVVGGGAHDAAPEICQLARALGAIVVTSANGKGVFPEDDELSVGAVLSYPAGREALAACDVVIAVGTELSGVDLEEAKLTLPGRVIRIDVDPDQLQKNLSADCAIHGDATDAIRRLLRKLTPRDGADGVARARAARERLAGEIGERADGMLEVADALRLCLDDGAIIACDTAMVCYNGIIPSRLVRTPRSFLNPTNFATLGYALPAGIGAKLAQPHRRVVVVTGDGGILLTLSELATAVEEKLQLAIVVANNRGYGEIRKEMISRGIAPLAVTFDPPKFSLMAEAFGARSAVVSDPSGLTQAVDAAFRTDGRPTLIELVLPS
jgi:acetolactate synthase-1/2/3 large subunit